MSALNTVVNKLWYGREKDKQLANELAAEFSKLEVDSIRIHKKYLDMKAENERLRAALEQIVKNPYYQDFHIMRPGEVTEKDIARAALGKVTP